MAPISWLKLRTESKQRIKMQRNLKSSFVLVLNRAAITGLLTLLFSYCSSAFATSNLSCELAIFNQGEEVIPLTSRLSDLSNGSRKISPYQWLSHDEIFQLLTRQGLEAKAALDSADPMLSITKIDVSTLRQILDVTVKSRLRHKMKSYQKFAYFRSVEAIEELVLQQMRLRTEESLPFVADDLIASLHRTLSLKGLYLTKAEREDYAKLIAKVSVYSRDSLLDIIGIYKDIRFQASDKEAKNLIASLKQSWSSAPLKLTDIETFANLTSVVPFMSEGILRQFISLYHHNLNIHNPTAIQGYSVFLWSLVQLNPVLAHEFGLRIIRNFPAPLSEKMGIHRFNQIAFANAYFKYVLKLPIPWLVELQKSMAAFDKSSFLKTSDDQTAIGPLLREHFPELQEEFRIPETPFVADFYDPTQRLIIELDGDIHFIISAKGADKVRRKDLRKNEILKSMGYQVIHFTNEEAKQIRDEVTAAEFQKSKVKNF